MSYRSLKSLFVTGLLGLSWSTAAQAQVPAASSAPPVQTTAPQSAASQTQAPAPTSEPQVSATPPSSAPPPGAPANVPPGYMLVPIPNDAAQTRYDVQYPQARGALPPGMELPYEDGDPIPPGYKLRRQARRGLVIAGSIVTGVPYAFSVTGAVGANFEDSSGFLLIPVLGPWLMLASGGANDEDCSTATGYYCSGDQSGLRAILVLDGLAQAAGATMFIAGIAMPRKRLVRSDVTIGMAPASFGRGSYGLGAFGSF